MDHDNNNSNPVASPGGGGGSCNSVGGYDNNNGNYHRQHQLHASVGNSSVYSNNPDHHHLQDLDNAFSRMSLYNVGSVVNNDNGNGCGVDPLYNRILLRAAMNRADQTPVNNKTPFCGSASPSMQNGYGSSSSNNLRFRSMNNTPFQPPPLPPPADPYQHLLQSNAMFLPPRNRPQFQNCAAFDRPLPRTDQFFDRQHFPQLERSYPNGGRRRGGNSGMMMMHREDNQFDDHHLYSINNMSFADLRGNLVNYAMDQHGCRTLQRMFEKMGREEFDILFDEVICYITQLMMDQYGNYIFQKLVQVCSVDQRTQIVHAITRDPLLLIDICLNSFGTRAVQELLMYLTTREQKCMMAAAFSHRVFDLSKDVNGHHVIVHCIKNFPCDLNEVFLDQLLHCCFELSTDQSGCCVVQLCVDHSRGEGRDRLVHEILSVAQLLAEDRFGNYVVQCLLRQMDQMINMRVWEKLKGNFTSLSCNKFGSNVVEACLEQSDRRHVDLIILEMLENPHVSTLFSDPFGNYVTQVALSNSKGTVHEALVREIQKHAPSLQSNQYGKMTLSWFDPKKRRRSMKNKNKYGQFHP